MIEFLIGLILFVGLLAAIGLVADWWDSAPRRDARERNRPRPWR
jgi:hypothetical protein